MTSTNEPHKRFRLRRLTSFSLRTALIAITILAVWLGLHMNSVRKQRASIETVKRHGGSVHFDYEGTAYVRQKYDDAPTGFAPRRQSTMATWLLNTFGRDHLHSVVSANIGRISRREANSADVFTHLNNLPKLEELWLNGPQLRDEELKHLGQITNLRRLHIRSAHVTEDGLRHLVGLKNLRYLYLKGSQVKDVSWLQERLPNCEIVL